MTTSPFSFVVDCHLHGPCVDGTLCDWEDYIKTYDNYLGYLTRCGVHAAIQNSWSAVKANTPELLKEANDYAIKLADTDVIKIMPACILNPEYPETIDATLQQFREVNSCWVGELCPYVAGWNLEHNGISEMVERIDDANFILQLHSGTFDEMSRIASIRKSMPFVISHIGNRQGFKEKVELLKKHDNLYMDICGDGYERIGLLEKFVSLGFEDRILFGSDFPINEPASPLARIKNGFFTDEVREKLVGGNTKRLLSERGINF